MWRVDRRAGYGEREEEEQISRRSEKGRRFPDRPRRPLVVARGHRGIIARRGGASRAPAPPLARLVRELGYRLVIPPIIEHLESLLVGTGRDLDLQTFKLTVQLSGRLLGVRADMTPQVARIDAHRLKSTTPSRLCYVGPVLHTRPQGFASTRCPFQVGAELYGHAGIDSDVEILALMVETLAAVNNNRPHNKHNQDNMFRGLAHEAGLN